MFKKWEIKLTNSAIPFKEFVVANHYSKSLSRGNKYVFTLYVAGKLRGVATFGTPVGKDSPGDLECKRFCLAPGAKKNVASWFMAKCIKQIKADKKYNKIVSYADLEQNHEGIIYRASNFKFEGSQKKKGQAILMESGLKVHLRNAYQKVNGVYTKKAQLVQQALKNKTAKYISLKPKNIYTYELK